MNRSDYFLAACTAGTFLRRAWVISCFSLIQEGLEDWKKDPYPYRLVQSRTGFSYVDPADITKLVSIPLDEGQSPNEPLFKFKEPLFVPNGTMPNVKKDIQTTYGNVLFNWVAVVYPFDAKIDFIEGQISPSQMEGLIAPRLKDTPPEGVDRDPKWIYVDEYLRFTEGMFYLTGFTQICVPALSEKAITAPPNNAALKAQLLEQNKDRLHDPAVIAAIDKALIQNDTDYLKGDDSEGFLISGKSRKNVRRKLYLMTGAEVGFGSGTNVDLVQNSLQEGWQIDKFPIMNDSLRAGSFNRGAQTQLGGEAVKWLLRASSNMLITKEDCGSKLGMPVLLSDSNKKKYMSFSVVTEQGSEILTEENYASYAGKVRMIRSPMFCTLEKTDYCAICCGPRLRENRAALSAAVSAYGSVFLSLFLSAAHAKALETAKMDYKTAIF